MKKTVFFGTLLLIIWGVSVLYAQNETPALPVAAKQPEGTKTTGRLVKIEGTVTFRPSFGAAWTPATLQTIVSAGGWLQTAKGARAILSFGKEAVTNIGEEAVLEVKEVEINPDGTTRVRTSLTRGKIWSLVEKLKSEKSRYEVETPTAIAGVRGTTFMVNVEPSGRSSRIGVVEGEVGVRSMGEKPAYVILKENMATVVVYNKPPTPPEVLEAREAAEWEEWKQSIPFSEIGVIGGMAEIHAMQMEEAAKLVRETGFMQKAAKKADEDFKVFAAALRQYYLDTGAFPAKEQGGLKALLKNPGAEGWNGPYVDPGSNFMDPYGKPYFYHVKKTPKGSVYAEIFSMGLERPVGNVTAPKKDGQ